MSNGLRKIAAKPEAHWVRLGLFTALFVFIVLDNSLWKDVLGWLFPSENEVLYLGAPLAGFVLEHLRIVAVSSALSIVIGILLGILVTRPIGKSLYPLVGNLASLGQTFPPVAVIALAVPSLGFGFQPTVFALFLFGLFPIVSSTSVALATVPSAVIDSARGMGLTPFQTLLKVELPLGLPVILGGIRVSVVINIGTAMIGALIGAGGLGSPVVAGLIQFNPTFILEGTLPAAFMAILVGELITNIERSLNNQPELSSAPASAVMD
jgi:osmoprotectant transport system permease protein